MKRIMSNGNETKDYDGRRIYDLVDMGNNQYAACHNKEKQLIYVHDHYEVKRGCRPVWLRDYLDGRYTDSNDNDWWIVEDAEFDEDGEILNGTIIGCARP